MNPAVTSGLAGALGAAVGGTAGYLTAPRKKRWQHAISGAGLGGLAGAGLGAAGQVIYNHNQPTGPQSAITGVNKLLLSSALGREVAESAANAVTANGDGTATVDTAKARELLAKIDLKPEDRAAAEAFANNLPAKAQVDMAKLRTAITNRDLTGALSSVQTLDKKQLDPFQALPKDLHGIYSNIRDGFARNPTAMELPLGNSEVQILLSHKLITPEQASQFQTLPSGGKITNAKIRFTRENMVDLLARSGNDTPELRHSLNLDLPDPPPPPRVYSPEEQRQWHATGWDRPTGWNPAPSPSDIGRWAGGAFDVMRGASAMHQKYPDVTNAVMAGKVSPEEIAKQLGVEP